MVYNLEDAAYECRQSATCRKEDVNFAKMERTGTCLLEVITDRMEVLYPVVLPAVPSGCFRMNDAVDHA